MIVAGHHCPTEDLLEDERGTAAVMGAIVLFAVFNSGTVLFSVNKSELP